MANYRKNDKAKTITINGKLTNGEKEAIGIYMAQGYTVKPGKEKAENKKKRSAIKDGDIVAYFEKAGDKDGLTKYKAEKEKKYKDKNDVERKQGFLFALKWFKENYEDAYNEMKKALKEKK